MIRCSCTFISRVARVILPRALKSVLLVRQSGIWSLQSTAHLKPFLRNFLIRLRKNVRYTPDWSNSRFQDLARDFQSLFYTNHEFENRTFDWVRLISFFFFFRWVRFRSIAELNRTQSTDWVRLKFSFYSVRFTMPGYTSYIGRGFESKTYRPTQSF